ncbi:MAG: type II secretion system protein [bacterium]
MTSKERKAFTLSETLVSMVLLGIVMALTIPSFISSFDTNQYRLKLKKSVRVFNEALDYNISRYGQNAATCPGCSVSYATGKMALADFMAKSLPVISRGISSASCPYLVTTDGTIYVFNKNTSSACGTSTTKSYVDSDCNVAIDVNGSAPPSDPINGIIKYGDGNKQFSDIYQFVLTSDSLEPSSEFNNNAVAALE